MAEELGPVGGSGNPDPASKYGWLEQKIQEATTTREVQDLVKLRRELIGQDEQVIENQHRRKMDILQNTANVVKSSVGLGIGAYLTVHGFIYPGMFVLGASLYSVAPKFVSDFFRRRSEPEGEQESSDE